MLQNPLVYQLAATGQAIDSVACIGPIPYIARCLDDVGFPVEHRWIFPVIKSASAVGLAAAPRFPQLARFTALMLTVYFVLAVGMHVRARDLRLNFTAASSLLLVYATLAATGPPRATGDARP